MSCKSYDVDFIDGLFDSLLIIADEINQDPIKYGTGDAWLQDILECRDRLGTHPHYGNHIEKNRFKRITPGGKVVYFDVDSKNCSIDIVEVHHRNPSLNSSTQKKP